jgi:hypothetical protein
VDVERGKQDEISDKKLNHNRRASEKGDVNGADLVENTGQELIFGHNLDDSDDRSDDRSDDQTEDRDP